MKKGNPPNSKRVQSDPLWKVHCIRPSGLLKTPEPGGLGSYRCPQPVGKEKLGNKDSPRSPRQGLKSLVTLPEPACSPSALSDFMARPVVVRGIAVLSEVEIKEQKRSASTFLKPCFQSLPHF